MHELADMPGQRHRGFALLRSVGAIAAIAVLASLPASIAAAQTASGRFSGRTLELPVAGAYSYWDQASGGNDRVVKVVVSNAEFRADLLDDWHDRGAAVREFFASDTVKIVTFDFDANGKYRGYSYYFAAGDGCGWCYDSTVRSTVRGADGRLRGSIAFDGKAGAVAFDVKFDVPIPAKAWGAALPSGGGNPGRVFLAYHKALAASDAGALKAVSDRSARICSQSIRPRAISPSTSTIAGTICTTACKASASAAALSAAIAPSSCSTAAASCSTLCTARPPCAETAAAGWLLTSWCRSASADAVSPR
jgi:hypothetical protein